MYNKGIHKEVIFMQEVNSIINVNSTYEKIIEKVNNLNDSLKKLNELFGAMNLNIEFDFQKQEAVLISDGKKIPMKKNNDYYFVEHLGNEIGFRFSQYSLTFHYGAKLEVIKISGTDFEVVSYIQDDNLKGYESPHFTYVDYKNNLANIFFADGHIVEFIKSNKMDYNVDDISKRWGIAVKDIKNQKTEFSDLLYGAGQQLYGLDKKGDKLYNYIPISSLNVIKNNCGRKKFLMHSYPAVFMGECSYKIKSSLQSGGVPLANYKKIHEKVLMDPSMNYIKCNNPKCLEWSLEILKNPEARKVFESVLAVIKNKPVYFYISIYYQHLIEGLAYYINVADPREENMDDEKADSISLEMEKNKTKYLSKKF